MRKKIPNTIYTLILTALTVISWVSFSIYRTIKKPLPIVVPPEIIEPLNPDINIEITEKLKGRKYFEEGTFKEVEIKKANPSAEVEEKTNQAKNEYSGENIIETSPEE